MRFGGLPLPPTLFARLRAMIGSAEPLPIQRAAMLRVFAGESLAIHSPTGSGKTLSYLLPLALRQQQRATPRQVLVVVPSRELAMQSLECAHAFLPPSTAALLHIGSRHPSVIGKAIRSHRAPIVIATAAQVGALDAVLSTLAGGDVLLAELRRTLRTVVLDESDAILEPVGRGGMQNRSRRDRALKRMPVARALGRLVERRTDGTYRRVQVVLASATLSRRTMRDLASVVGRGSVGRVGLVTPASPAAVGSEHANALDWEFLNFDSLGQSLFARLDFVFKFDAM